jgi:hypothetical protein
VPTTDERGVSRTGGIGIGAYQIASTTIHLGRI